MLKTILSASLFSREGIYIYIYFFYIVKNMTVETDTYYALFEIQPQKWIPAVRII